MYESRRYEQDQRPRRSEGRSEDGYDRQWRDQGDSRFSGNDRRGDDSSWDRGSERSTYGMRDSYSGNGGDSWNRDRDGGYRGGDRQQDRMNGGFESDRWMDAPRNIGERDSSRSWRVDGAGTFSGGYDDGRFTQRSASQGGGYSGGPSEWGGSYAGDYGSSNYDDRGSSSAGFGERRFAGRHSDVNAGERGTFSGRGPKGYQRSDERIREQVCERLTDEGSLDASDIEVEVKNCEVTLKGSVRDRQQKRRAEDLAESCSGVKDVTNNIRVSRDDQSDRDAQSQSSQRTPSGQSGSQRTNGKGSGDSASM